MLRNSTSKDTNIQNNDTYATSPDDKCKIYEATESFANRKDPFISLPLDMPQNANIHVLRIIQGNKTLTQTKREWPRNANLLLREIFAVLNTIATGYSIKQFKIQGNDDIFKMCTIQLFKSMGNDLMKDASIIIINPLIYVSDKNERKNFLDLYHNNATFGGHVGKQRMLK